MPADGRYSSLGRCKGTIRMGSFKRTIFLTTLRLAFPFVVCFAARFTCHLSPGPNLISFAALYSEWNRSGFRTRIHRALLASFSARIAQRLVQDGSSTWCACINLRTAAAKTFRLRRRRAQCFLLRTVMNTFADDHRLSLLGAHNEIVRQNIGVLNAGPRGGADVHIRYLQVANG